MATILLLVFTVLLTYARASVWRVEIPMALLLLSTLVWRVRDTATIASNPFDLAGIVRIGMVLAAGGLAVLALADRPRRRVGSAAVYLYAAYVTAAFISAAFSVKPVLTLYRGVELAVVLLVVLSAVRSSADARQRQLKVLLGFFVALAVSVWLGVLYAPGEALAQTASFGQFASPLTERIQGVVPYLSSDETGFVGALLCVWAVALYVTSPGRSKSLLAALAMLGIVTLVASQYRTGYVEVAAGLLILMVYKRRTWLAASAVAAIVAMVFWGHAISSNLQGVVFRGENAQVVSSLNGRATYWAKGIDVWKESPIFGKGLSTATRFEVLEPLGFASTATIHSSWIEALVGTGVVGVIALAGAVGCVVRRAFRASMVVPMTLVTVLLVRSLTLGAFELTSMAFILFAVIVTWVYEDEDGVNAQSVGLEDAGVRPRE
jgi:O-antigen ligase